MLKRIKAAVLGKLNILPGKHKNILTLVEELPEPNVEISGDLKKQYYDSKLNGLAETING